MGLGLLGAGGLGGWDGVLVKQLLCLPRVPKSERATVHKNLTFSLASAEGFLMASEWAKDNEVGGNRWAGDLRGPGKAPSAFSGSPPSSLSSIPWEERP